MNPFNNEELSNDDRIGKEFLVIIFMLMIYMGFETFKHQRQLAIGHATAVVILIGFLLSYVFDAEARTALIFNDSVFFYICLPALLFTIGFSMQHRHFFRNFKRILMFGVVGTFI